jgi:hypothetical protein
MVTEETVRWALAGVVDDKDTNLVVDFWRGLTVEQVAAKNKLTQGRVKHRYFRAVELLRDRTHAGEVFDVLFRKDL